jgi:hypothetical protein
MKDDRAMTAYLQLTQEQQHEAMRRMARTGSSAHEIARVTRTRVEYVARVLAEGRTEARKP